MALCNASMGTATCACRSELLAGPWAAYAGDDPQIGGKHSGGQGNKGVADIGGKETSQCRGLADSCLQENVVLHCIAHNTRPRRDTQANGHQRRSEHSPMILDVLPMLAVAPLGVWGVLWDILVLLAMALVLGTVAERLGQSVIVGYLIAGTLVGPNVLGWTSTERDLFNIAELGVALLLFAIGLEFSPRRLLSLGRIVLKTGPLQVLGCHVGWTVALVSSICRRLPPLRTPCRGEFAGR